MPRMDSRRPRYNAISVGRFPALRAGMKSEVPDSRALAQWKGSHSEVRMEELHRESNQSGTGFLIGITDCDQLRCKRAGQRRSQSCSESVILGLTSPTGANCRS